MSSRESDEQHTGSCDEHDSRVGPTSVPPKRPSSAAKAKKKSRRWLRPTKDKPTVTHDHQRYAINEWLDDGNPKFGDLTNIQPPCCAISVPGHADAFNLTKR